MPGAPREQAGALICRLLLDAGFPLQNRSFRPHFLNRKCRSRHSASIGALRAPKFRLRETTKTQRLKKEEERRRRIPCSAMPCHCPGTPRRARSGRNELRRSGATLFPPHSDFGQTNISYLALWYSISAYNRECGLQQSRRWITINIWGARDFCNPHR